MTRVRFRANLAFVLLWYMWPGWPGVCPTGARETHPRASSERHERARRLHGEGAGAPRGQPQDAQQYVLDETETFEMLGPARMPVYRRSVNSRGTSATACTCAARCGSTA